MLDKSTSYMLAVAASIYGVLAYTIAFCLEIWFIFNSDNLEDNSNHNNHHDQEIQFIIPMTSLIQASIYFVLVIISLFLILGVTIKSIVCLLCWIISIILALPLECGLVLYTCLNIWKINTRNGQIELCFFVFRFIMNTFFVIFVYNLIKQWKRNKLLTNYMNSTAFSTYPYITTTSLRPTKNPAFFTNTAANFDTYTKYSPNFGSFSLNDLAKIKNLSVKGLSNLPAYPYYTYFEDFDSQFNRTDHLFPSEFDTNSYRKYKMIRKPLGLEIDLNENKEHLKNHYYTGSKKGSPALSEMKLNSINYEQPNQVGLNENVVLRQLATKPFDYLNRPGSVMNLNQVHQFDENENFNSLANENTGIRKAKKDITTTSLRDVAL